jgi:hypothetical protein
MNELVIKNFPTTKSLGIYGYNSEVYQAFKKERILSFSLSNERRENTF